MGLADAWPYWLGPAPPVVAEPRQEPPPRASTVRTDGQHLQQRAQHFSVSAAIACHGIADSSPASPAGSLISPDRGLLSAGSGRANRTPLWRFCSLQRSLVLAALARGSHASGSSRFDVAIPGRGLRYGGAFCEPRPDGRPCGFLALPWRSGPLADRMASGSPVANHASSRKAIFSIVSPSRGRTPDRDFASMALLGFSALRSFAPAFGSPDVSARPRPPAVIRLHPSRSFSHREIDRPILTFPLRGRSRAIRTGSWVLSPAASRTRPLHMAVQVIAALGFASCRLCGCPI